MTITEAKTKKPKKVEKEEPQSKILVPPLDANSIAVLVRPLDPRLPVVEGRDVSAAPSFSTQDLGTIFFQRSAAWVRWVDRRGLLDRDALGRTVKPHRLNDPVNGIKRYSLVDVEMTARILHQNGLISAARMQIALQIIDLIAIGYGIVEVE